MSAISVVHGSYSQYINMMSRDREWGDGIMLAAIRKCYNRPVVIHNEAGERVFGMGGSEGACDSEINAIHLIYAENHYKSLRHPVLEDVRSDHSNKRDCDSSEHTAADSSRPTTCNQEESGTRRDSQGKKIEKVAKEKTIRTKSIRKFKPEWQMKYFVAFLNNSVVCVICYSTLAAVKDYNIKRHYAKHHTEWDCLYPPSSAPREQKFDELLKLLLKQQRTLTGHTNEAEMLLEASYKIAWTLASASKPFTDGNIVKCCLKIACDTLFPDKPFVLNKVSKIPLGRTTVTTRITEASIDIQQQIEININSCDYFSLALDESTDISDTAQLVVFVRCISPNFEISEELLGLSPIRGTTTGKDIKDALQALLVSKQIDLKKLVSITTDGAPSMCGRENGALALMRKDSLYPGFLSYHCVIHQQSLCSKYLKFKDVMTVVVEILSFIRARALNHRQFKVLLEDLESDKVDLVYFTEVRWLSRGKVLDYFCSLLSEIRIFLASKDKSHQELSDPNWLLNLAFLTDITGHLNVLNKQLQGENKILPVMYQSIEAFQRKLALFSAHLSAKNRRHFPMLDKFVGEVDPCHEFYNQQFYCEVIDGLATEFERRFTECRAVKDLFSLVLNPFSCHPDALTHNQVVCESEITAAQLELLELQSDAYLTTLRNELCTVCSYDEKYVWLWKMIGVTQRYPVLTKISKRLNCMFGSTYRCEAAFSQMKLIKSKYRNKLNDEHLLHCVRAACTKYKPRFDRLVKHHYSRNE